MEDNYYIIDDSDGSVEVSVKVEQAGRFVVAPYVGLLSTGGSQSIVLSSQNGNLFNYQLGDN